MITNYFEYKGVSSCLHKKDKYINKSNMSKKWNKFINKALRVYFVNLFQIKKKKKKIKARKESFVKNISKKSFIEI